MRQLNVPYLSTLLNAAMDQKVLLIHYESRKGETKREVQPVGIYASNGLWYCPAYCFDRKDFRLFRCDRVQSIEEDSSTTQTQPLDLRHVHIGNWELFIKEKKEEVNLYVELSQVGVQRCETELWPAPRMHIQEAQIGPYPKIHVHEDGTGWLDNNIPKSSIPFFTKFFIGLGNDATVKNPPELVDCMKRMLSEIMAKYNIY